MNNKDILNVHVVRVGLFYLYHKTHAYDWLGNITFSSIIDAWLIIPTLCVCT